MTYRTAENLPPLTADELPADWRTRSTNLPLGSLQITAGGATWELRRPHGGYLGRCQVCTTTVVGLGTAGEIGGLDEFGNAAHRVCAFNLVAVRDDEPVPSDDVSDETEYNETKSDLYEEFALFVEENLLADALHENWYSDSVVGNVAVLVDVIEYVRRRAAELRSVPTGA